MKNLLLPRHRNVLRDLLREHPLLAFDYDGTLAPIVSRPERVRMRARTEKLFEKVAGKYPVAVVSGRSRKDVRARTSGFGVKWWVGNHGSDWGHPDPREARWLRKVAGWRETLEDRFTAAEGFEIEDKGHSLSVHYRHVPSPKAGEKAILEAAVRLPGCRIIGGKQVVNLVPRSAPHKGTALKKLLKTAKARSALFLGDDVTDEDAFQEARGVRNLHGVRIGIGRKSAAEFGIPDQAAIDGFLALILELS